MQDDSWYTSFVGKSTKSWQNPASALKSTTPRRRDTLLEGKKTSSNAEVASKVKNKQEKSSSKWDLSVPSLAIRSKSYSDFHNATSPKKSPTIISKSSNGKQHLVDDIAFDAWYNGHKDGLLDSSHAKYQLYQNQLAQTQAHLESILTSAESTLSLLTSLADSFRAVDEQTTEFQAECEGILAEQRRTAKLADDVAENLQYYNYLDPITKRLNASGAGSLVRRSEFPEMLANLDACLEYMQEHPKHKESATYATKYKLLLTRALTLIRNHFTASLRDIAADVSKRIADRQLNDTTMSALLYAKFKVGAPDLKRLGQEIERRVVVPAGAAPGTEGEYQGLMNELYQNYATTRGKLLRPIVVKKISEMAAAPTTSKDLVSFARSCTSFLRGLCADEFNLWGQWFSNNNGLYPFLETLCEPLYDHLRPKIIHETKIQKLCELCTLIQTRYLEDSDSEDEFQRDDLKLDFGAIVQPALQDAQDRLVFLAQLVVRNDIQYFKPKPEHLDYPRKASRVALSGSRARGALSGQKDLNGPLSPSFANSVVDEDALDREVLYEAGTQEYYPTLRKAIWLLSRIYRLIHSTVFDSLAHEIVHQTALSLDNAVTQISQRVSPTDANLFLLSHLLALKHHILAFDIEFAATDVRVEFSSSLADFRSGLFNPAKWVRAIGSGFMPRVITDMKDARIAVDERLRTVIGDLVNGWAQRMTAPVVNEEQRGRPDARKGSTTAKDAEASALLRETIEREVPLVRKKLDEYIHDRRTRDMLMRAVLEDVLVKYANWLEGKGLEAAPRKRTKGKGREDGVWEEDAFAEWALAAFGLDASDADADAME